MVKILIYSCGSAVRNESIDNTDAITRSCGAWLFLTLGNHGYVSVEMSVLEASELLSRV